MPSRLALSLLRHPRNRFLCRTSSTSPTHSLPRIAQPSIWHDIIPRFLRPSYYSQPIGANHTPWYRNPATPILILGMLCGSQAVHIIRLKQYQLNLTRQTEAKLSLLKDLIERVQAGEEVDIKKELGTGDPQREQEWEDVIRELEDDGTMEPRRVMRRERREQRMAAKQVAEQTKMEDPGPKDAEQDRNVKMVRKKPAFY